MRAGVGIPATGLPALKAFSLRSLHPYARDRPKPARFLDLISERPDFKTSSILATICSAIRSGIEEASLERLPLVNLPRYTRWCQTENYIDSIHG
jgi:hypothetical protein